VAHDFNNLLGVISNYAAFAGEQLASPEADLNPAEIRDDITQVEQAAERAASLTRSAEPKENHGNRRRQSQRTRV
jgi:two-component system, cell cycle sensor histidine kinase and response regulator CckA